MICFLTNFVDTRRNNEDFAITPYLFGFVRKIETARAFCIGLCWGWKAVAITIVFGMPNGSIRYAHIKNLRSNSR